MDVDHKLKPSEGYFYPLYELEILFSMPRSYWNREKKLISPKNEKVKINQVVMDKSSIWQGRNMTFI